MCICTLFLLKKNLKNQFLCTKNKNKAKQKHKRGEERPVPGASWGSRVQRGTSSPEKTPKFTAEPPAQVLRHLGRLSEKCQKARGREVVSWFSNKAKYGVWEPQSCVLEGGMNVGVGGLLLARPQLRHSQRGQSSVLKELQSAGGQRHRLH